MVVSSSEQQRTALKDNGQLERKDLEGNEVKMNLRDTNGSYQDIWCCCLWLAASERRSHQRDPIHLRYGKRWFLVDATDTLHIGFTCLFFFKFVNGKRRRTGSRQQNDRALRNPFYPNRFPPFFKAEKEKSIVAKKVDAPAHTCGALKRKVDLLLARPNEIFWGEMRAFISASKRLANKLWLKSGL